MKPPVNIDAHMSGAHALGSESQTLTGTRSPNSKPKPQPKPWRFLASSRLRGEACPKSTTKTRRRESLSGFIYGFVRTLCLPRTPRLQSSIGNGQSVKFIEFDSQLADRLAVNKGDRSSAHAENSSQFLHAHFLKVIEQHHQALSGGQFRECRGDPVSNFRCLAKPERAAFGSFGNVCGPDSFLLVVVLFSLTLKEI